MKETNSDIEVINLNLNNHIFYHGTSSTEDVIKICKEGFKSYWIDEDGKCDRDGNLGIGIYLTCNWKTAVWFGNILLRTSLRKGTRIIDTSQAPDKAVVAYLKKEFGNDIIKSHNIRKVLPKNKQLKLHELVALTRYHYNKTWERDWGNDQYGFQKWTQKRKRHGNALDSCVSLMKQYGFHGYGNPSDDNGIVIFQPDRIILQEIVVNIPPKSHSKIVYGDYENMTLQDIKRKFSLHTEEIKCRIK